MRDCGSCLSVNTGQYIGLSFIPLQLQTQANIFLNTAICHTELQHTKFLLHLQAYSNLQVCLRKYKNCEVVLLNYITALFIKTAVKYFLYP